MQFFSIFTLALASFAVAAPNAAPADETVNLEARVRSSFPDSIAKYGRLWRRANICCLFSALASTVPAARLPTAAPDLPATLRAATASHKLPSQ